MIKFKQKEYGANLTPKEIATLGLSTAALGVSGVNAATNVKRSRTDKEYQKKQIKAMEELTKSLDDFDKSLKEKEININVNNRPPKKKKILRFFQKNNSHTADFALKGAKLGAGLGIVGAGILPNKLGVTNKPGVYKKYDLRDKSSDGKSGYIKTDGGNRVKSDYYDERAEFDLPGWDKGWKKKAADVYNNSSDSAAMRKTLAGIGSIAIGAILGSIVGMVYDAADLLDKKNVDKRLMKRVVDDLKKMGFKENQHFTVNPKTATLMKTKVCLGISRSADTMKLLVNTVNDPKLTKLAQDTTKNLPSMSTRLERVTDRFNDINITTASGQGNSTFVSSIAEKFIRAGYPVQLVEVG